MTVYSLKNQCLSLCLEERRHGRQFFLNTRFSGFRTRVKLKSCCSLILAACDRQLGWATCPGSSVSQRRCVVPVINISDEISLENVWGGQILPVDRPEMRNSGFQRKKKSHRGRQEQPTESGLLAIPGHSPAPPRPESHWALLGVQVASGLRSWGCFPRRLY